MFRYVHVAKWTATVKPMALQWPQWLRLRKAGPRDMARLEFVPLLELDRVRTALSCIILAGLLGLIIIGGRKASGIHYPDPWRYGLQDMLLPGPP